MTTDQVFKLIKSELYSSNEKHRDYFASTHEAYAVIKEELEEFWEDVKKDNIQGCIDESVQIAAMCVKFLMNARTEI